MKTFFFYITESQVQVNLFQKHLFLHQLTHNMTKDCSLNYKFSRVQCIKIASSVYVVIIMGYLVDARKSASEKDLPVLGSL